MKVCRIAPDEDSRPCRNRTLDEVQTWRVLARETPLLNSLSGDCCIDSGTASGAWAFAGTRVPVYALFENLASGATIDEFVEWFPGVYKQQVRAVPKHEARALRAALAH